MAFDGIDDLWVTQNLSAEVFAALSARHFLKQKENVPTRFLGPGDPLIQISLPRNGP